MKRKLKELIGELTELQIVEPQGGIVNREEHAKQGDRVEQEGAAKQGDRVERRAGALELEVSGLVYDSRQVALGCVFFCIPGFCQDGHVFAEEAVKKGASVLVTQQEVSLSSDCADKAVILRTADVRHALAVMSAAWFGHPARALVTIGITGTKGKTTTAYMIYSILKEAGIKAGLIGTVEVRIGQRRLPAHNTTPESYLVQKLFRQMADEGCSCVVMEVSSQGLMLGRVDGFIFDYGIFTNLEPDHIGPKEHQSFAEYRACKARLFRRCRHGIVNADDANLAEILKGHTCTVETFALEHPADWKGGEIRCITEGKRLSVAFTAVCHHDREPELPPPEESTGRLSEASPSAGRLPVTIGIPGRFNVSNALAAIALCRRLSAGGALEPDGEEKSDAFSHPQSLLRGQIRDSQIRNALQTLHVRGRMEAVEVEGDYLLLIDYAHNAMSLKEMLVTIREYQPGRIVCMFGCGGNRSRLRRFEMGEVAARYADLTVITSDNPRYEKPSAIMEDIRTGVYTAGGTCVMIEDRREAVRYCFKRAQAKDVIVLAGKGHESYQEIEGKRIPMDDREIVQEILTAQSQESGGSPA